MKSEKTTTYLIVLGLFFWMQVLLAQPLLAQQLQLTGRVTSEDNKALPGVSVIVKGTAIGTLTDQDGKYAILVPREAKILVFSSIGMLTEEKEIGQKTQINMVLIPNITILDDVVVVGYGTSSRKDVTGSIASISGDELRKIQPTTFDQALQGKMPGVIVQQVSGQPGGGVSVQIRGISSFTGGTPLYIIDGVVVGGGANMGPGTNPLAAINPSEIESVDVLKDASATAIYGSQASNGVVIITTKRGKVGPPKISYDFYTGLQQIARTLPTMNLREFATFINERNSGIGWGFDTRPQFANPQYLGEGTNWQKELFRNAPTSNHTLSVSGGDERTQYLFSLSYFKQDGIALGSGFNRISVRLNLDNKTTNWLKIGTSLQLANIRENYNTTNSNVIATALSLTPDIAVRNPDGSWGGGYDPNGWVNASRVPNPVAVASVNKAQGKRYQIFGNAYAQIDLLKNFNLRNEVSGSFALGTDDRFSPTLTMGLAVNPINSGSYSFSQSFYTVLRNYLNYSKAFKGWDVSAMAGHEAQLNVSESVYAARRNFPSNEVQAIDNGDAGTATNGGSKGQNALESYFGRVNLNWHDRFLFTVNLRRDGSSKFSKAHRWVNTYSGSLGWNIHNEQLFKQINAFDQLKLRVGYGLTNNQNVRDYAYTSVLSTVNNGLSGIAQLTSSFGNSGLQWETTKYFNAGLDGSVMKNRISFSVDFYIRHTDGLLLKIPMPAYTGLGGSIGSMEAPFVNIGAIDNHGFEFRISSNNIKSRTLEWKTDFTLSHNTNKVLRLNVDGASLVGYYGSAVAAKTIVGRSIGEFYGYVIDGGVFAKASDFETHALPINPTTGEKLPVGPSFGSIWYGDLKFKDLNGDGVIDESDQTFLGSPIPRFQLGLNNTFRFKNFDLTVFFSSNVGNKVLNGLRIQSENPGTSFGYFKTLADHAKLALIDPNGSSTDINNVYVTNPTTRIVGLRNDDTNNNNRISDKFIEDASFIRCRNISLGYTFPEKLLSRAHIQYLRIYANVTNAFLITRYKGMDPEIGSWNPLQAGMDNGFYPQSRVLTMGLNLSLNK
ncbi:TonB-dependent receptor [Cytophagaceae bacterium YF14B1]|uniref:TonB-dependent receptor n=1 Tax=Xanthocytophaga flava TaxID=3048013 RepID=A0AAE3QZW9_9BACT|nr:TonB-dependent receptor [Xanthocytophaga flavus]MDJ1485573.1 TonB-dependent receptor [Xanthocytophaga flavus]